MFALNLLPSFRQQNLLIEFAALKQIQLQGIYLSLTPNNPSVWSGTLFVRRGVYAPAIFRFRVSFPSAYPFVPPVVAFNADIFHPLLTPLTTYTYATSTATDATTGDHLEDERLPPGAFSIRHGFPTWVSRSSDFNNAYLTPDDARADGSGIPLDQEHQLPSVIDLMRYMRKAFEDERFLDSLPFEAAVNPSAWYAWQSHRGRHVKRSSLGEENTDEAKTTATPRNQSTRPKHPSEWNWEGVWTERVDRAVQNSLTEHSLYGNIAVKDDDIHFLDVDQDGMETMREDFKTYVSTS